MLGYPSFNHYVIEDRMAKTPESVLKFLDRLEQSLKLKAAEEKKTLAALKASETKNPQAELKVWDYNYYSSLYKKKTYNVDLAELKKYFPLSSVLPGMLNVFSDLFGLTFEEQSAGTFSTWHSSVRFIHVIDSATKKLLGAFYLDLYPRPGKYGHAAAFSVVNGKLMANGTYSAPVGAMVCNFSATPPSLLSHSEVETLFHEMGHILHGILTVSRFEKFSGTSVAWDFVEAPSQILENWCWDAATLNRLATLPPGAEPLTDDFVKKLDESQKAGMGLFYLRQVAFAKSDLAFHAEGETKDSTSIMNKILTETFMPPPPNTTFQAGWGHMTGYASGYYGYAWADVMAADLFSFFKKQGLMDAQLGLKLRSEIYAPGSSRDENDSLQAFLGRPLSDKAFFENLGLAS
jgi:Zn-dependent oligopeptidase